MSQAVKNAVIAGIVALVVALAVLAGAKGLSPPENSGVPSVAVMAPDGSVLGHTAPTKMASSGPPVPACTTANTFLECQGIGVPFTWGAAGFGDGGLNEAFGKLVPGTYEAGTNANVLLGKIAIATLTPALTNEVAITGSVAVCCVDSGANPGSSMGIYYSVHGDTSTLIPVSATVMTAMPVSDAGLFEINGTLAGALALVEAGASYDFYLVIVGGSGNYLIGDASLPLGTQGTAAGGIWVHEFP